MSRHDEFQSPDIYNFLQDLRADDDRFQLRSRLRLKERAAAEEERLRSSPEARYKAELTVSACQIYTARPKRSFLFKG